ncbi:MAG: hypothetical protein IJ835_06935, partial [Muribaculaceae bacterium]|nr:hypothetical protein [Muribaculaceae bacterium]
ATRNADERRQQLANQQNEQQAILRENEQLQTKAQQLKQQLDEATTSLERARQSLEQNNSTINSLKAQLAVKSDETHEHAQTQPERQAMLDNLDNIDWPNAGDKPADNKPSGTQTSLF